KFKDSLKKGDKVVTAGGIYGIIDEVCDTYVFLEIANGVKIKIDKSSLVASPEAAPQNNK
ncbi:MAG: preprotein translocase subunit YajC, partial [Bacteroidales bacterium]|nr:preprotein translocase subunit YajC [Bacteroidales bacterium]